MLLWDYLSLLFTRKNSHGPSTAPWAIPEGPSPLMSTSLRFCLPHIPLGSYHPALPATLVWSQRAVDIPRSFPLPGTLFFQIASWLMPSSPWRDLPLPCYLKFKFATSPHPSIPNPTYLIAFFHNSTWRAAIHGVAKSWTRLSNWSDLIWPSSITRYTTRLAFYFV